MRNRDTHNRLTVCQITAFEEYLRTEEREQTTIEKYLRNIRVFAAWLGGAPVTKTAVIVRTSTERPEAVDKGCFILAGIDAPRLLPAVDMAVSITAAGDCGVPVPDYLDENVSGKVVRIIQSFTGVVDRMVWRKTDSWRKCTV